MDQLHPPAIGKTPAQDLIQSLMVGQRGATEELKALCKELQTLLDDLLSARPELMAGYQELMRAQLTIPGVDVPGLGEQDHPETHDRRSRTQLHEMSAAQCKRECERSLLKSVELVRECARIRQRSKAMRAALRGATPSKLTANLDGKDGGHAQNGKDGSHGPDGKNGHNGSTSKDRLNHDGLSRREFQVLRLIVDGKTSRELAAELGISFKTAVTHRASIMSKLDVHETASVVREAIHRGLV